MTDPGFKIELVGGPKDGEAWTIVNDEPVIRFASMDVPDVIATEFATAAEAAIRWTEIEYLRTRVIRNGRRIYTYYSPNAGHIKKQEKP